MATPRDVLVVTTGAVPGITIKKYLKPVSAHLVAGTGFFSDLMGGLSDVFGGRSETYQNHLSALYADAIERLKIAAYEIGSNCIIGLNIDFDEISGKGKSMFMVTAIGTAVIIDTGNNTNLTPSVTLRFENVAQERIDLLRNTKK